MHISHGNIPMGDPRVYGKKDGDGFAKQKWVRVGRTWVRAGRKWVRAGSG